MTMEPKLLPLKRKPQRLMACITRTSLENMRNRALFALDVLDAKGIRRRKYPLYECLILELREKGYVESSDYLNDLIYDNTQLLAEDDIGIVVDLRKREDYLEHIAAGLQKAEKERDREDKKRECLELLKLALFFGEEGKGILWLAEKLFLASIAVASHYLLDGGRQKACCKYHYAKFLLDKFPGADEEEPFKILTEVRDASVGKGWPLYETENVDVDSRTRASGLSSATVDVEAESSSDSDAELETVFTVAAIQLHRVLLNKVRAIRDEDPAKGERLSRLAERRAIDANQTEKLAEAIIEIGVCQFMMNNLNNAMKTLNRANKIYSESNNIEGLCETKMHMSAVLQKMGEYAAAAKMLTEMGALAMEHSLRRQLGRALHMLGELHLLSERPELGTQHLSEAFSCFMGLGFQFRETNKEIQKQDDGDLGMLYSHDTAEIYIEEAEQSRLMMAISGGQEYMASYFNLIREGRTCAVAQMKTIEWKLLKAGWWVKRQHHDFLPCPCPAHNRTPLDVLKIQEELREQLENMRLGKSETRQFLERVSTIEDMRKLRSSYYHVHSSDIAEN